MAKRAKHLFFDRLRGQVSAKASTTTAVTGGHYAVRSGATSLSHWMDRSAAALTPPLQGARVNRTGHTEGRGHTCQPRPSPGTSDCTALPQQCSKTPVATRRLSFKHLHDVRSSAPRQDEVGGTDCGGPAVRINRCKHTAVDRTQPACRRTYMLCRLSSGESCVLVGTHRVHVFDVLERDEERYRHHHVQRQQVT